VSCALGCPYEGSITPQKVTEVRFRSCLFGYGKRMHIIFQWEYFLTTYWSIQQRLAKAMEGEVTPEDLFDY
jgi:hypothetical protein